MHTTYLLYIIFLTTLFGTTNGSTTENLKIYQPFSLRTLCFQTYDKNKFKILSHHTNLNNEELQTYINNSSLSSISLLKKKLPENLITHKITVDTELQKINKQVAYELERIKLLIFEGANLTLLTDSLDVAIKENRPSIITDLLTLKADLTLTNYPLNTHNSTVEVLTVLFSAKADPNKANTRGYTLLHSAAQSTDTKKITTLLNAKAHPLWHRLDNKETPLFIAKRSHRPIAQELLENAAAQFDGCNNASCTSHPKNPV